MVKKKRIRKFRPQSVSGRRRKNGWERANRGRGLKRPRSFKERLA